jgi:TolB-like protein/DNA-binding winged helix-turn-helix (wHTH) protein/Flp pilus assembly protein TadD
MSNQGKHLYEFGAFRLNPLKRRLLRDGEPVPLTPKAFDTLLVLVEQAGKTVGKDDLMNKVWPDAVVEENNLNQNITTLRKSLGDSRHESQYIATIPGFGYRFVADVRKVDLEDNVALIENQTSSVVAKATGINMALETQGPLAVVTAEEHAPSRFAPDVVGVQTGSDRRTRPSWLVGLLLALALLAAVTIGYVLLRRETPQPQIAVSSIAVLPLENLSGDPEQEYFADGMTDALIGDLANLGQLRVISRTSSMQYKGTKKSLPQIAAELKVDAVVEGTVQRSGDRVTIRAQLIHAATDHHLWSATYERDLRDILDLQKEIAQIIALKVQTTTSPLEQAQLTSRRPIQPKAFDDYLQGRYLYWNKRTEENLVKAIEYFQSAINEDSNYARAYVGLADCYNALGAVQFGRLPPMGARRRAEEAALKALELDAELAEAHTALGYARHFNWNWVAAEQEFKRAIELNPNYANAHNFYASYLMSRGRVEESLAASNRARELDPLSLSISANRGFLLENARRYDEAIEQLNRVIAVDPNHYQAYWFLGHTYAANGQIQDAIAASEKAVELSERSPGALGMLGLIYGLAGRKSDATRILNELLKLNETRYVTPAALANTYIGLGDKDRAFLWLERAYEERSNFIAFLKVFPIVDPLRSDPRFDSLLERTGLAP